MLPVRYPGACGCLGICIFFDGDGVRITYLKLVTGGVKHHLCAVEQPSTDAVTLCGCVVTRAQNWKQISSLEGDECPQCVALAFGGVLQSTESEPKQPQASA